MPGRYLLDTNVAIAVLNRTLDLAAHAARGAELYLSVTVVGELYFGAENSGRVPGNLAAVDRFVERCPAIQCTQATAREYGRLKSLLRRRGQPTPENDLWIAATAVEHQLTLVTRDEHFDDLEGVAIERW